MVAIVETGRGRSSGQSDPTGDLHAVLQDTDEYEEDGEAVPPELQELRQRLAFLKTIYQNSLAAVDAVREEEFECHEGERNEQESERKRFKDSEEKKKPQKREIHR